MTLSVGVVIKTK